MLRRGGGGNLGNGLVHMCNDGVGLEQASLEPASNTGDAKPITAVTEKCASKQLGRRRTALGVPRIRDLRVNLAELVPTSSSFGETSKTRYDSLAAAHIGNDSPLDELSLRGEHASHDLELLDSP